MKIGTIREIKLRNVCVSFDAVEDYDADLSFDDTGDVRRRLNNGDLVCFCLRVRIFVCGTIMAESFLGECIYERVAEVVESGHARDMLREAVCECRESLNLVASAGLRTNVNNKKELK